MVVGTSKLARFPVKLPTTPLPDHVDIQAVVINFSDILSKLDDPETYLPDAVWRDHWALTGTLRTFYSAQGITKAWTAASKTSASPVCGSLKIFAPAARRMDLPNGSSWLSISGSFDIKTKAGLIGKCTIILSVVPQGNDWKIWSFGTILDEIEEWPSVHQFSPSITNGEQQKGANHNYIDVVVVGAGQTGLSMAGRLSALGVNYLLIDKYPKVGDSWGKRYDSVKLHTPREYSHLPFERTFPDTFPEYLSKDQLAQGFNDWSCKYGVDKHTWLESELVSGKWDDLASSWKLHIRRKGENASIGCRFVIMAVGSGGQHPYMPDLPGRESFKGVEMHSADYKNCQSFGANARGVVVGTGNTAHDVAEDMADAGLPSTMVQRSRTYIMPAEHWKSFAGHMYNEHVPTDMADTIGSSQAQAVGRLLITTSLHAMAAAEHEAERFDGLTRAGYDVARFGDLLWVLTERAGGYYMDVGACQKIIDGKIKIKSGQPVRYTENGLGFGDGSELAADAIVWATGFKLNLREKIGEMLGKDVAARIDDYWGVDDEGELRGVYKLQHPGLIMHGLAFGQARFYSKFVALQIKAVLDGKKFEQYLETPVPVKLAEKVEQF